jgi:PAS domain S-box-containing protein
MAQSHSDGELHNTVIIDEKDRIVVTLRGKQTGQAIKGITKAQAEAAAKLQAQNKKILILVDLSQQGYGESTSEGRRAAKHSFTGTYDRIAIYGGSKIMSLVGYLFRFSGQRDKMQFFSNRRAAVRWLDSHKHAVQYHEMVSLISGLTIATIGILTLIGWHTNNEYLTRWLTSLRPMNPMAAVGLVAIGFGFCSYWLQKLTPLKVVGVFGILLGIASLTPLHLDHLLYADKLAAMGLHTDLADSAALCFIAVGLTPFTVGTNNRIVRLLQYIAGATIIGLSLFNVFAQLYAHEFVYSLSNNFVMSFGLAVAFLAVGVTLVLLILYRQSGNVLGRVTRTGWLILFALIGVQALAYGMWYQAQTKNMTDSSGAFTEHSSVIDQAVEQRVRSYIDALYGFRGLYASSDSVTQGEFQSYYDSLNLTETYPGLRALSFISAVDEKDLPAFLNQQRKDTSLHAGGNPGFNTTNKTTFPVHYIFTYNASNPDSVGGSDLSGTPIRKVAYEKAAATNKPVASGTLEFPGTNGEASQRGFFITMPVSSKGSNGRVVGFVSAVFNYKDFFNKIFANNRSVLDDLKVSVIDTQDKTVAFSHPDKENSRQEHYYYADTVPVADRVWGLKINAVRHYGISRSQAEFPWIVLAGSQLFSGLLVVIFIIQSRGRRQALELAESITEDLQQERNMAVSNDQKSSAILASIGDAVFAVDRQERITLFNPAAVHISGFSEEEAFGKQYDTVLNFAFEDDHRKNDSFIRRAFDGHVTSMKNRTILLRKDGKEVAVADSAAPIRDAKGKIQGVIVVFRDVSKEKVLDKAKTEFVSLASHQLRTPLSAINWYSEMLLNGDAGKINKDQHEYLQEIYEGNKRMVELVDSLLNVSRLEVGKLKNDPQPTSLIELADSLEREMETSTRAKQMTINNQIEKKLPIVSADPKLLRMILQNLLSNAVKYTADRGDVTLTMRTATDKDLAGRLHSGHYVFLSVADTGYGIPQVQQDKIFQKLFRADNVRKLDVEGTGLGLYIVKEVAEKLGGTIWFESIESIGTTFYVLIPVKTNPS